MNRPRVRFADDNTVNGEEKPVGSTPLLVVPGVLRVVLQEGQSRSFQFNPETTAGDIVSALCDKLDIKDSNLYSLVLIPPNHFTSPIENEAKNKFSDDILIPPWDHVAKVVSNPSVKHHECHFRLTFVAKDIHKVSREDPNSFQYHYRQCVNDVVSGDVYSDDLSADDVFRLASLQMLEHSLSQSESPVTPTESGLSRRKSKKNSHSALSKITLKQIEKDFGLSRFLPPVQLNLVTSNHSKEHRKTLQQHLKTTYATYVLGSGGTTKVSPPSSPSSPSDGSDVENDALLLRLRMQYIKTLSPLHLYGGRYFEATILAVIESDIILIVGYHYGISQLVNSKTKMASIFANFSLVQSVEVAPCLPEASKTNVRVDFKDMAPLVVSMHPLSAQNFAYMISGYCRVHENNDMMLTMPIPESSKAPEYFGSHKVKPSDWNYPPDTEPSSLVYCDFSEPVSFCLLSDQIPESVRAMFQQSKIVEEEGADGDDNAGAEINVTQDANAIKSAKSSVTDDEGVALVTSDTSPKSSVSSTTSASPSSGIGSVTSQTETSTILNQQPSHDGSASDKSDEEGEWNQLSVTVYANDRTSLSSVNDSEKQSLAGMNSKESLSATDEERIVEQSTSMVVGAAAKINSRSSSEAEVADEDKSDEDDSSSRLNRNESELDFKATDRSADEKEDATDVIVEAIKDDNSQSVMAEDRLSDDSENKTEQEYAEVTTPVIPVPRQRFSSFKPASEDSSEKDLPSESPKEVEATESSGNAITSDEFKAQLGEKSLSLNIPPAQLQGEVEEIAVSPMPVADLAQGHRSIKSSSQKQKSRRSWFGGGGGSISRSVSLDNGLSNSEKKSRSLFRNFFSPKRSYSVGKEKSSSSFFLHSPDPLPGSEPPSRGRWKFRNWFKSPPSNSQKSKFSFFKSFSRKKRSHVIHTGDISSPEHNNGVYAVFEEERQKSNTFAAPVHSASTEDVNLRSRGDVSPKARPVSFMTFQTLPMDFKHQQSPSSSQKGKDKTSPVRPRSPNLPLTAAVRRSVGDSSSVSDKEVASLASSASSKLEAVTDDVVKADSSKSTPPAKPVRSNHRGSIQSRLSDDDSKRSVEEEPNVVEHETFKVAGSDVDQTTVRKPKRKAPTPPVVLPKPPVILPKPKPITKNTTETKENIKIQDDVFCSNSSEEDENLKHDDAKDALPVEILKKDNDNDLEVIEASAESSVEEGKQKEELSSDDGTDELEIVHGVEHDDEDHHKPDFSVDEKDIEENGHSIDANCVDEATEEDLSFAVDKKSNSANVEDVLLVTEVTTALDNNTDVNVEEKLSAPTENVNFESVEKESSNTEVVVKNTESLDFNEKDPVVATKITEEDRIKEDNDDSSLADIKSISSDSTSESLEKDLKVEIPPEEQLTVSKKDEQPEPVEEKFVEPELLSSEEVESEVLARESVDEESLVSETEQPELAFTKAVVSNTDSVTDFKDNSGVSASNLAFTNENDSDMDNSPSVNNSVISETDCSVSSAMNELLLTGSRDHEVKQAIAQNNGAMDSESPIQLSVARDEIVLQDGRLSSESKAFEPSEPLKLNEMENGEHDLKPLNGNVSEKSDLSLTPGTVIDLSKIEPGVALSESNLSLHDLPPPPEKFNALLPLDNSDSVTPSEPEHIQNDPVSLNGNDLEASSKKEELSSENAFEASKETSNLTENSAEFAPSVKSTEENNSTSTKPTSGLYQSLIAPRLFGQAWEKKTFSSIKPPVATPTKTQSKFDSGVTPSPFSGRNPDEKIGSFAELMNMKNDGQKNRAPVIRSVAYPVTSRKPSKPALLPKPTLT